MRLQPSITRLAGTTEQVGRQARQALAGLQVGGPLPARKSAIDLPGPFADLTRRQLAVVWLIVGRLFGNLEAARQLRISVQGAKKHVTRILRRVRVASRMELVHQAHVSGAYAVLQSSVLSDQ
jgi:DNA-binding CsgD family transcriptional regulator